MTPNNETLAKEHHVGNASREVRLTIDDGNVEADAGEDEDGGDVGMTPATAMLIMLLLAV